MDNKAMKPFLESSIIAIIALVAGFYMGQSAKETEPSVESIKSDTIREKIGIPIPYQVEISSEPVYIYKTDALIVYQIIEQ